MSRKVTIEATVNLTLDIDEGVEVSQVLDEMDLSPDFANFNDNVNVEDCYVENYEITDSR